MIPGFHHNIIGAINAVEKIDTVVISSYNIEVDELYSDNIFYTSSKDIIGESLYTLKCDHVKTEQKPGVFTSNIILNNNLYRNDLKLTSHLYPYEIFKYIQDIESVFFFGSAWDICVQERPLGVDFWKTTDVSLCFTPMSCLYANDSYVNFQKLATKKNPGGWYNLLK